MTVGVKGAQQFQAVFSAVIPFKLTADFGSAAAGAAASVDLTVPGAALGDFVLIGDGIDVADLVQSAQVTAADTVTVTVEANTTSGTVDLASQTLTGVVLKAGNIFESL